MSGMLHHAILALDLSLTRTGICTMGGSSESLPTGKRRGMDRVAYIVDYLTPLVESSELVVIEGYSFGSQGRAVFQIGELGGCVRLLVHRQGIPLVEVPPSCLKKYATGKGNCGKDDVLEAAIRRFHFEGHGNDEADAYLLWAMARHHYGVPVCAVPATHAAALAKVEWPG